MALRNQPYFPLYVQDFLTDEKLIECSAEATGVYIRLMCIFHKGEVYGGILLKQKDKQNENNIKNFAIKLSKQMPYDLTIIENSLKELIDEKVLMIEDDLLFQKRMLNDGILSDKRSCAGKKGVKKKFAKDFAKANDKANNEANTSAKVSATSEYEIENENEYEINNNINKNSYYCCYLEKKYERTISSTEIELLNYLLETYDKDLVKEAIKQSVIMTRKNLNYVKGILKNWKSSNINTLEDLKRTENEKERDEEQPEELFSYDWLNDNERN